VKYLMLVCVDPTLDPTQADTDGETPVEQWVAEHDAAGVRVLGDRVRPADDATTVRIRRGELLVTDGPFGETKEQIAGFDVLDCTDLDHAIEVARQHPMARHGYLELRPFWVD
jgi:hypothetical protein